MNDDDRRVHLRIGTTLPCVVQSKSHVHAASLLDLSRGGAKLEIDLDIAHVNDSLVIGLALPDQSIAVQANADVVRREQLSSGFRYGLRFSSMDSDARQRLNAYIADALGVDANNHRLNPRMALRLEVSLDTKDALRGVMRDVSQGGLGLVSEIPVVLDESVRIDVRTAEGRTLPLPGRIAYVHTLKNGQFAVGVAFAALKQETLDALSRFLTTLR